MPSARPAFFLALTAALALAVAWSAPASPARRIEPGEVSTGFVPSRHGLPFPNPAPDPAGSLLRRITTEQCGGMTYLALESYALGRRPRATSPRASAVQLWSAASIAGNGGRFVLWSMLPDRTDRSFVPGVVNLTRRDELPRLQAALREGPVPIGLVRARSATSVGLNHQVVAYGLRRTGNVITVRIYDPTQPAADDITLVTDLGDETGAISERAGDWEIARWRGLFIETH